MLLNPKLRKEFYIELISQNSIVGGSLKTFLSLSGYTLQWHKEVPQLNEKSDFPHVTILDVGAIKNVAQFIEERLKLNGESLFLILGAPSLAIKVEPLRVLGVYGVIVNLDGMESQALMQLDLVCSELFLRYQNEQLNEKMQDNQKQFEQVLSELKNTVEELEEGSSQLAQSWTEERDHLLKSIEERDFELRQNKTQKEQLVWLSRSVDPSFIDKVVKEKHDPVAHLFHELSQELAPYSWSGWYFKFIPEIQSFVVTQYHLDSDAEQSSGYTFKSESYSLQDFMLHASEGVVTPDLKQYLEASFGEGTYHVFGFHFEQFIEGFFCVKLLSQQYQEVFLRRLQILLQIFQSLVGYHRIATIRSHDVDRVDPLTQLETRDLYYEKLNSELARSARLNHSLCVIKVAIDNFKEIGVIHGQEVTQILIGQVAMIIKSSNRINDFVYRTGDNEFSVILPHTPLKGATIRAERLRRIVEAHCFVGYIPEHATISVGISEYPLLVSTMEELDSSALQALNHIQKRSQNKVCLYSSGVSYHYDH
jgi:diguanylate cyclase (GGDEF)-like protein